MKVSIHHWRYSDGVTAVNPGNPFGEVVPPRGWTCWAYPYSDDAMSKDFDEFERWLDENCPSANYTRRFNSGDPMVTIRITNQADAALFMLTWGVQ